MWARIIEILIAVWLIVSRFLFSYGELAWNWTDIVIPAFIVLWALLSFFESLNKMHLLQILPAFWLLYISYSYPTPWLPFGLQNHIIVALLLLTFAIIPCHASKPPRPWRNRKFN